MELFFNQGSQNLGEKIKELMKFLTHPNPTVIAIHFLSSFFVIIFIIYYFWKPTNAFINKQKNKLDKAHIQLATATKETKEALTRLKRQQKKLKFTEKQMIIKNKIKGEQIISEKIEEAEKLKASIIQKGREKARKIEEDAKKTVNDKVIGLSVELTEKLIGASINQKVHTKVINNYISNIDEAFKNNDDNSSRAALS